jgi:hypothetical protein
VTVLAEGRTAEGEHWQLTRNSSPHEETVSVLVTSVDGHPYGGTGCGLDDPPLSRPGTLSTGSDDDGPAVLILQVRADVRAAVVQLSDGTREDLRLHPLPGRDDRVAVLVHHRRLDVHRIDLYDVRGMPFPDPDVDG